MVVAGCQPEKVAGVKDDTSASDEVIIIDDSEIRGKTRVESVVGEKKRNKGALPTGLLKLPPYLYPPVPSNKSGVAFHIGGGAGQFKGSKWGTFA